MMEQENKKNLHRKVILAFVLMIALIIPVGGVLFTVGKSIADTREREQEQIKEEEFSQIVAWQDKEAQAAQVRFDRNLSNDVQLMTSFLKEYVTKEGFTGPRVFSDGFVVELKGGKVLIPEGVPGEIPEISLPLIEESLLSGAMRTGSYLPYQKSVEETSLSGEGLESDGYYLSFSEITENCIYVQLTEKSRFKEYLDTYSSGRLIDTRIITEIFDGITFVAADENGTLEELEKYGEGAASADLSALGITSEMIAQETIPDVELNDQLYHCICVKTSYKWRDRDNVYMIQLLPVNSSSKYIIMQTVMTCLLMLLIFVTLIVYALSEQSLVMGGNLTTEEAGRYNPVRMRGRLINAGIVGAITILIAAFLIQAVGQMHRQIRHGRDVMDILAQQLEESTVEQSAEMKALEEEWYVQYSERIASIIGLAPEMGTKEKIREFRDILNVDYIMLFDSEGKELFASNEYEGFSLDLDTGEKFLDFNRLLKGIPSIVHEASVGDVTELERQIIGVKMKALDDPEKNGALLMALMPDQTSAGYNNAADMRQEMKMLHTGDILCFEADRTSGMILNSSDVSMIGKTVKECGLSETSLQDNYMDFGKIKGTSVFIVTNRHDDVIFYYTDAYGKMMRNDFLYAIGAVLLFALTLCAISFFLLKGYDMRFFNQLFSGKEKNKPVLPAKEGQERIGKEKAIEKFVISKADEAKQHAMIRRNIFWKSLSDYSNWNSMLPEKKAGSVFSLGLSAILILMQVLFLLGRQDVYGSYDSLFGYLLNGDWMRGFNLFSMCGIAMVLSVIHLFNVVSGWILHMLSGFLSTKGETICKLIRSLIRYGSVAVAIVLSLRFVGVLSSTVIASLGLGSLAISLGAKDLVADILAGIFIVFDETLSVGDYVEYEGRTGKVLEIGMRYTRLEIPVGNILNVSNQEIRTVMNLSKSNSRYELYLRVRESESMLKVENLLYKELPEIAKKSTLLRGPIKFLGVTEVGNSTTTNIVNMTPTKTVCIGVECEQKNMFDVQVFLNREICLLFEREGIEYF